jgi:hypothetical protein
MDESLNFVKNEETGEDDKAVTTEASECDN